VSADGSTSPIESRVGFRQAWAHRRWRALLASTAVSGIGDWLYFTAFAVWLFNRTGSALLCSLRHVEPVGGGTVRHVAPDEDAGGIRATRLDSTLLSPNPPIERGWPMRSRVDGDSSRPFARLLDDDANVPWL